MATNPWSNFNAAEASRRVAARPKPAARTPTYNKSGMPPVFYSAWRPPTGAQDNAVTRALARVGGNAVTNAFNNMPAPSSPGGGRSGGGGGGGGGGAAAPPAVNQAMIDALAQALGVRGQQLTYQNLPAFQGQRLGAFNTAPYDTQRGLVDSALAADQANFNTNQAATTTAVEGAYRNPYATAQAQAGPQTQAMGAGLMGTVGAAADPAVAQQMNAQNAQNQGTFQDLYGILGASNQASQNSRMAQVAMDANYGRQQAGAQATGLRGGIANNQATAAQQWQQAQAERDYQNNLMQQQWAMQNAQGRQSVNQANWTQQQSNLQSRLQPILDLISKTAGISGLNMAPLMAALQGQAR